MNQNKLIPSVNFHLWQACNMRCGFCFAKFQDVKNTILPKGHLPKEEAIKTVNMLADFGFTKITFVGGEPTLCPWISELIKLAKKRGLITMIVSNGTRLSDAFLSENKKYLDWIAISVDSLNQEINKKIGRVIKGKGVDLKYYENLIHNIHKHGYKLKINTVVNKMNIKETMTSFINFVNPDRWKVFKVLPIIGQNNNEIKDFEISDEEYNNFLNNQKVTSILIKEDNNHMTGSYVMVDPAGRFFDNTKGKYTYSSKIIDLGVAHTIQEVETDYNKFIQRGGDY